MAAFKCIILLCTVACMGLSSVYFHMYKACTGQCHRKGNTTDLLLHSIRCKISLCAFCKWFLTCNLYLASTTAHSLCKQKVKTLVAQMFTWGCEKSLVWWAAVVIQTSKTSWMKLKYIHNKVITSTCTHLVLGAFICECWFKKPGWI